MRILARTWKAATLLAAALLVGAVGCARLYRPERVRAALDRRAPEAARETLDALLTGSGPSKSQNPGRNTGLLLLERGSVRLALGDYQGCVDDLSHADRLLDSQALGRSRFLTASYNPRATVYMYERGWSQALNLPYGAKFYERLLINPLLSLCRLQLGDVIGACTEARRFGVMSDWTEQVAPGRAAPVRAFGELVSTLACSDVDPSLACGSLGRARALGPDMVRQSGLSCELPQTKSARLVIVVGYGRPSHPESEKDPSLVHLASGDETRFEAVGLWVDDRKLDAPEVLDVEASVRADYDDGMHAFPVRFLGQDTFVGGYSNEAWQALPAHIHLALIDLPPGRHEMRLEVRGQRLSRDIALGSGESRTLLFSAPW